VPPSVNRQTEFSGPTKPVSIETNSLEACPITPMNTASWASQE
jgi:hypothetical protein